MASSAPQLAFWRRPWFWSILGFLCCCAAGAWLVTAGEAVAVDASERLRLALIWVGILAAGIGVALRLGQAEPSRLAAAPAFVQAVLALLFGLLAMGVTANLIASWFGEFVLGFRPGLSFVFWLLIAPMSALAAWQCFRRRIAQARLERSDEGALSLVVLSLVALLGCFGLASSDPEFGSNWATIQRFFFVAGIVALVAAPLAVVDGTTRRWVVSGLVTFHLFGIVTAAVSHPPTPWIFSQLQARIYRPYLQFMYLSNAYHFYSPEPGPASHLWFYLYYEDEAGKKLAHWYKVPKLNDRAQHGHTTSLEYQRTLALTEQTFPTEVMGVDNPVFDKILARRLAWTPEGQQKDPVVGVQRPKHDITIPLNPGVSKLLQYHMPQRHVKRLVESYTRFVLYKNALKHPDRKYTSVRFYRVVHAIPQRQHYMAGSDPADPIWFVPVYLGEFDENGKLLDENDPLLYWQVPILKEGHQIRDWARRHAGDPYWIREVVGPDRFQWVDDKGQPAPAEK